MEANRMFLRATALVLALSFAAGSLAAPSGNATRGKQKAAPCAACHGDGNKTLNDTYPKLAGQYPEYLAKSMHEYKNGKRKNAIMSAQAAGLSDQDIADLAAYYAAQKAQVHDLSSHAK